NTTDSVVITRADVNGGPLSKIIYVNDAFTLMSGYLPEDVLGKSPRILEGPKTDQAELDRVIGCLYAGLSCETSMVNYRKNGTEFWNNFSVTPVANENGLPDTWISIQRDVTKEKTDEIRKELFNDIAEVFNSPGGLHDILKHVLEIINKNTGFSISEIWLPDTYRRNLKLFATRAENEAGIRFYEETKSIRKIPKGEGLAGSVWEMMDLQLLPDLQDTVDFFRRDEALKAGFKTAIGLPLISNGTFIGVLALVGVIEQGSASFDITGEDLGKFLGAEIKRKQLENELDQIFNFAPDIIAVLNFKGYFRKINVAACEFLGYSDNELLSEPVSHFVHPDDREKTMEAIKISKHQDISHFENRYITKSGKTIWMSWTATSVAEESSIFAVGKDITARKDLEDLLFKSNSLAMIGSWEIDPEAEKVYCSELACAIIEASANFKPDEETISLFLGSNNNRKQADQNNKIRLEQLENWDEEILIKTLKGNLRWIRTIGQTEIVNGKCIRAYGSIQDINSRKIAEAGIAEATKELEESEKRYHELFHLSPLPMWVYDFETLNFLDVNKAAENSYGYSHDQFLNMSIRDIRPEEDLLILEKTVSDNAERDKAFQGTFRHLKKDGKLINADIKTNPIMFNGRKAKLVVATDITERLLYINTIEQQNEKLKEIAWIQSHVVRAPLARILALTDMFSNSGGLKKLANADIIKHIEKSAKELDEIIREISVKSDDSKKII
ncbi:MAG: PAS domain S-box protein, partial [Sphingobacteriales bacterium]